MQEFVCALLQAEPSERLGAGDAGSALSYEHLAGHPFLAAVDDDADAASFVPVLFDVDASRLHDGATIDVDLLGDLDSMVSPSVSLSPVHR